MKTKLTLLLGKAGESFRNPENWLPVVIALVMLLFMIQCISVALTNVFSFDGAMDVQAAQNLEKNFSYATSYQGKVFDPQTEIGMPVMLPVAILFSIFGKSFAAGLMVNAIYLILLAFAILYYLKKCLKLNNALVLLAFLMLYATHLLFVFGFGLYGEIPALFYLVVVLIFLHKHNDTAMPKFLFWAGVFLGLGYLTKTVILICVPALLFAVIFDFVVKRRLTLRNRPGLKRFFQEYVMLPAGFLVPVFVFELYKLISLGFPAYFRWWNDYFTTILNRAGVTYGYSEPNGVFARFLARLNLLSSFVGINKEIIIFLLVLVLFVFFAILTYGIYCFLKKQEPGKSQKILFSNDLLVLITVTLSYYGWWLLIVPENTVWERYILNGYILLEICLVLIVSLLAKYGKKLVLRTKQVPYILYGMIMFGYIGLLVVGSAFNIIQYGNYYISFRDTAEKIAYLQAGQMICNLPTDAEIFGYDWWQAPVVEFTSGRTFDNLFTNVQMINPGPLNEKYFVVDFILMNWTRRISKYTGSI